MLMDSEEPGDLTCEECRHATPARFKGEDVTGRDISLFVDLPHDLRSRNKEKERIEAVTPWTLGIGPSTHHLLLCPVYPSSLSAILTLR